MTREEKQLLLKDLCGRLPYGVRVKELEPIKELELYLTSVYHDTVQVETVTGGIMACSIEAIKPYLRPISSMTSEELSFYNNHLITPGITILEENLSEYLDWMHSHHFDYRGLIEMGLALEAQDNMYK